MSQGNYNDYGLLLKQTQNKDHNQQFGNHDLLTSPSTKANQIKQQTKHNETNFIQKNKQVKHDKQPIRHTSPQPFKQSFLQTQRENTITSLNQTEVYSKPKINKKSQELVEAQFKRIREQKDKNGKVEKFFMFKSQETQTLETYGKEKQVIIKKKVPKQTPKSARQEPKQNKTLTDEQPITIVDKVNVEIQTDEQKTPEKSNCQKQQQSGQKEQYYIPVHQRCDYILLSKKNNMETLKLSLSAKDVPEKKVVKIKPVEEDDEDGEDRITVFIEKQNNWLARKNRKLIDEKVKKAQQEDKKKMEEALQDENKQQRGSISKKSKRLAEKKYQGMDFLDRQTQFIEKKQQHIQKLRADPENCTFAPRLSPQSRIIAYLQMEKEQRESQ